MSRRALIVLALGLVGSACARTRPFVWVQDLPPAPAPTTSGLIQPRDTLLVEVRNQRELSGEFVVRDDGHYSQPAVGSVPAAGHSPMSLSGELKRRLVGILVDAQVSVWVSRPAPTRVHVVGEVRNSGSYELGRDRSVAAALAAAGWLSEFAGSEDVYVLRTSSRSGASTATTAPAPRIRFRVKELTDPVVHAFQLHDGDVVVVE